MVDQELFHPIGISHTFAMMANHAQASIYVGAQFIAPSIVHDVNMGCAIGLGRDESRPYMTNNTTVCVATNSLRPVNRLPPIPKLHVEILVDNIIAIFLNVINQGVMNHAPTTN